MTIRNFWLIGLVAAALALGAEARAEDPAKPPAEPTQGCAHHAKAMHGMGTHEQREAYCRAHPDCMSQHCGGMGAHEHQQAPAPPAQPKAKEPKS